LIFRRQEEGKETVCFLREIKRGGEEGKKRKTTSGGKRGTHVRHESLVVIEPSTREKRKKEKKRKRCSISCDREEGRGEKATPRKEKTRNH